MPGNPVYLEYVRSTVEQKRERYAAATEEPKGNPELVYETQFIEGWEPSGEPVSTDSHGLSSFLSLISSSLPVSFNIIGLRVTLFRML